MKLTFLGATHEVTGSCTLLEACGKKIIIPVTADGPGKADARIEISGIKGKLKSRYGLTEANSDGSYHFRATDVNSDILEGELL